MNDWLAAFFKAMSTPEAAGSIGSLISLRWAPGDSWLAKLASFAGGLGFALFISPWIVEYLEIKSQKGPMAFAFVGGLVGMNLLAKAWEFAGNFDFRELVNIVLRKKDQ